MIIHFEAGSCSIVDETTGSVEIVPLEAFNAPEQKEIRLGSSHGICSHQWHVVQPVAV